MKKIITQRNQMVYDIAIQHMGSVEAVIDIMKLNPALELETVIAPGTELIIPDVPINKRVADYYNQNNIVPVSGGFNPIFTALNINTNIVIRQELVTVESPVYDLGYCLGVLNLIFFYTEAQPAGSLFSVHFYGSDDDQTYVSIPGSYIITGGSWINSFLPGAFFYGRFMKFIVTDILSANQITINKLTMGYEKYS